MGAVWSYRRRAGLSLANTLIECYTNGWGWLGWFGWLTGYGLTG